MAASAERGLSQVEGRSWRGRRLGRRIVTLAALGVLLASGAAAIYAYDQGRRDVIANGVRVGSIDLSGLNVVSARERLRRRLVDAISQPVSVVYQSRRFSLGPRQALRSVNIDRLVQQALDRSRRGSIFSRTLRGLFGGSIRVEIPLVYSYNHAAVRAFAARVRAALYQPVRNAAAQPNASGLLVSSHDGVHVEPRRLAMRVEYALAHPSDARSIAVPARILRPAVTTSQLAARYPSYIVVDRGTFTLRLYRRLKLSNTYRIAVGMQGLQTPPWLWHIQWMQVNPPWYVPHASWTGALAGKVIPPGPSDPLKARFMSFDGGAGIHGIDPSEYATIGHTASHGCIRMTIPDVIDLYSKVTVGTPVYII